MQSNEVKAFRQRLVRAGFSDIIIYEQNSSVSVSCYDPLGVRVNSLIYKSELHLYPIKEITYKI